MKYFACRLMSAVLLLTYSMVSAQEHTSKHIAAFVELDSVVITAKRKGFSVEDFIDLVRNDRSFYQAFQNLRYVAYRAENEMFFYDRKKQEKAAYKSLTQQQFDGYCRSMKVLEEESCGNFYKKKRRYRYYTAKLFDRVFFTHGKVCQSREKLIAGVQTSRGLQKHYHELKKMIFHPGEKIDFPIIGGKTAIFSEKLSPYYSYAIKSKKFNDQIDCYVFSIRLSPEFTEKKKNKTIVKFLETYFEKKNFQVIGRKYHLSYTGLISLDVAMEVQLTKVDGLYLPQLVKYEGLWNVPTKRKEVGSFSVQFSDFMTPE